MTFKSWLDGQVREYRTGMRDYFIKDINSLENHLRSAPASYRKHLREEIRNERKQLETIILKLDTGQKKEKHIGLLRKEIASSVVAAD